MNDAVSFVLGPKGLYKFSVIYSLTYYTIDRLCHRYAAPRRQREREVISAVKQLN
jgi:hypothetical protein